MGADKTAWTRQGGCMEATRPADIQQTLCTVKGVSPAHLPLPRRERHYRHHQNGTLYECFNNSQDEFDLHKRLS